MTIQNSEPRTSFKVIPLPECPAFWWHHRIINFEIWESSASVLDACNHCWRQIFQISLLPLLFNFHLDKDLSCWFCYWFYNFVRFSVLIASVLHWTTLIAPSSHTPSCIHFSVSCNSSACSKLRLLLKKSNTFFDLVGITSFFCSALIFHFSTNAEIHFICNQQKYFSSMFPKRLSSTTILFIFTCFFNSGSSGCNNTGTRLVFPDDCVFHKISGPWHYLSVLAKFLKFIPLETSSAGFSFDGTYFHCSALLFSYIICTLFATKVLNALVSLAMYPNTTLLSVQKYSSNSYSYNSSLIKFNTFTDSTAAASFSLGIETNFLEPLLLSP